MTSSKGFFIATDQTDPSFLINRPVKELTKAVCPQCCEALNPGAINLAEGVALCPKCGELSRLSDVVRGEPPPLEVIREPPPGCSVIDDHDGVTVYSSLRSTNGILGTLFVSVFWNGIVSIFVLVAAAGLFTHLVGPVPAWFPTPEMETEPSLGETIFLCVFLIPFVTVGLIAVGALALCIAGRIEVQIGDTEANVRTGIGIFSWRRRFDPTRVRDVQVRDSGWQSGHQSTKLIVIEADRWIKFGSLLVDQRREWLKTVLQKLLVSSDFAERSKIVSMITQSRQ